MLNIILAFVPWIVFWFFLDKGQYALGISIAAVLSIILNILHIKKLKDFEVASLIFLVGCYFFRQYETMFKLVSYGYLTLVIFGTLVFKRAFVYEYMKLTMTQYSKSKVFTTICNIITFVWGIVFTCCAVVTFFDHSNLSIIFILFGVIFSIFFPRKAPGYFAYKDFKKYDWETPSLNVEDKDYDAIIIGAGIGGLSTALLLADQGYKIIVLEQHFQAGGYCSAFKRNGFNFNTGVVDISGVWEKGPVTLFLQKFGINLDDIFVRNTEEYRTKGKTVTFSSSAEKLIDSLQSLFPQEKENTEKFFEDAKKAYLECYENTKYGIPIPDYIIAKVDGWNAVADFAEKYPTFFEWLNMTYQEKLDQYFKNEELKWILSSGVVTSLGIEPKDISANMSLGSVIGYYLYGGYYPKKSPQYLADMLVAKLKDKGIEVRLKSKVEKIIVENNNIKGIKTDKGNLRAPIVISNANAKDTFEKMVGVEVLGKKFVESIKKLKMSNSCMLISLGLNMDLSSYPTIVKNLDDNYIVVFNTNADKSSAPEGKSNISVIVPIESEIFYNLDKEAYIRKKEEVANLVIQKVEKIIPKLCENIIVKDIATPKTFERYTLMPKGAQYGFDQSSNTRRPYFKTPVRGLYLVGASVFPGGGIEAVIISGITTANDILNWKKEENK